jgi:signal transduction histidine kinase
VQQCLAKNRVEWGISPSNREVRTPRSFLREALSHVIDFFHNGSRVLVGTVCILLVGLVGLADYLTGYERSILVVYFLPVALGTWFVGRNFGLVLSVITVAVGVLSDVAAGIPEVFWWNAVMVFACNTVITWLVAHQRSLLNELDQRVRDRTAALQLEIGRRQQLEKEVAEVTERERRRLGQDLHDSLCQHLTGTALVAHVVSESLAAKSQEEAAQAAKVVRLVEEGIDITRNLARGFFSPDLEAEGLQVALQGLAQNTQERCNVECRFLCNEPVCVRDSTTATQLYRIAQEAVTNAIKHGRARQILIELRVATPALTLTITDDGEGLPDLPLHHEGLGLRIMSHSAGLIGGRFTAECNGGSGTVVTCALTTNPENLAEEHEPLHA